VPEVILGDQNLEAVFGLIAIAALIVAIIAINRASQVEKKLDRLMAAVMARQNLQSEGLGDIPEEPEPEPDSESQAVEPAPEASPVIETVSDPVPIQTAPPQDTKFDQLQRKFAANLSDYWVFWLSGISLALGGLFLVRYGIEAGYLGPTTRVMAAICFGLALIGVAEWLRQKQGGDVAWFDLPTTLAAAGIFSLFGGVLAGHVLYDLTNETVTFAALSLAALVAVGAGFLYGPMLSVIGVLGAYLAPFLLKSGDPSFFLLVYFALVFAAALTIERYMQWIWLSAFAAGLAVVTGWLVAASVPLTFEAHLYAVGLVALSCALPAYGLVAWPQRHMPLKTLFTDVSHTYPAVFAIVVSVVALGASLTFESAQDAEHLVTMCAALALVAWLVFAMHQAEPLKWVALVAIVFAYLALFALDHDIGWRAGASVQDVLLATTTSGLVLYGSLWRSERTDRPRIWYWTGALMPVGALVWIAGRDQSFRAEEAFAAPEAWGVLALGHAFVLGSLARIILSGTQRDRRFGADLFATGALLSLGFAATLLLDDTYYAHAFAALGLAAAMLRKEFKFRVTRHLVWIFVTVGLLWLLTENTWALDRLSGADVTSVFDPILTHGTYLAAVAIFAAAWRYCEPRHLPRELVQFETATLVGLAAYCLVWVDILLEDSGAQSFVSLASSAVMLFVLTAAGFYRLTGAQHMVVFRYVLSFGYGLVASILLGFSLSEAPLATAGAQAAGTFPIDALTLSSLPIILALVLIGSLEGFMRALNRWFAWGPAAALGIYLVISLVRWLWHGAVIDLEQGFLQPELYTYSVMLLLATGVLVWLTLARQSLQLKRYALALAGLTAAKVFLVDISGMNGLSRATIFMLLGAALGGIAWLLHDLKAERKDEEAAQDA